MEVEARISELPRLRDQVEVFRDRTHAGEILADMMASYQDTDAIVLAIPAGGVPVAAVIARQLNLPLDVAITSKIVPSWNSEIGYGAIAFDGTVSLNEDLISHLRLTEQEIQQGIENTKQKVQRRLDMLRGRLPLPKLSGCDTILVDDGLASGFTMLTAVTALRKAQAEHIIVAVPTAHQESLQRLIQQVDTIYCPNIRSGWRYAVADAYQYWSDIEEKEVKKILNEFHKARG